MEKAPIIKETILINQANPAPAVLDAVVKQRDADHEHYQKELAKLKLSEEAIRKAVLSAYDSYEIHPQRLFDISTGTISFNILSYGIAKAIMSLRNDNEVIDIEPISKRVVDGKVVSRKDGEFGDKCPECEGTGYTKFKIHSWPGWSTTECKVCQGTGIIPENK